MDPRTARARSGVGGRARRAPGGRPRASCEFFHQPGELSFWLPLTESVGGAAMHVAADAGDGAELRPISLVAGQCASWWGHRLRSGFVGTNQGETSVVGLQFDVIPWSLYRESREAARRSSHDLRLGGHYAAMQAAEPEASRDVIVS